MQIRISLAALVVLLTLTTLTAHAQYAESVLYNFDANGNDEAFPWGNLVSDASGNLYGATEQGGAAGYGSIFEASPTSTGWNVTELYSFTLLNDGGFPKSGVITDAAGNLYGTTYGGGSANYGTAWELSPSSGGTWTLTTLHNFWDHPTLAIPSPAWSSTRAAIFMELRHRVGWKAAGRSSSSPPLPAAGPSR